MACLQSKPLKTFGVSGETNNITKENHNSQVADILYQKEKRKYLTFEQK